MSARLVDEVARHAPAGLTSAERLILVMVADAVNAKRHEADRAAGRRPVRAVSLSQEYLAARCGMDVRTLREYLRRLATANARRPGLELRVPIGKGSDGRRLYTVTGSTPKFVLPVFDGPEGCACHECTASERPADPPAERPFTVVSGGAR